jgi:hypothetical protein
MVTGLTNAFSKKVETYVWAIALQRMHYSFSRIHRSLRVTPAMAARTSDHVRTIEELVQLLDKNANIAAKK